MTPFYFIDVWKNCEGYAGEQYYHDSLLNEMRTKEILQSEQPAAGRYLNPAVIECESDAYTKLYGRFNALTALLMKNGIYKLQAFWRYLLPLSLCQ